ncbi:MAG: DUF72 domain-containing protein [Bryobacteraceae bacterium]
MSGRLYCGTSGFAYLLWKPGFYPEKLSAKKLLGHYASRLNAVEINYTFRQLPSAKTLENWMAETPSSFRFALKGNKRISHFDRLAVTDFSRSFFEAIVPLRAQGRLGPILFQLPSNFAAAPDRLSAFLDSAPAELRLAFEFRNRSWFTESVWRVLREHRAALCLAESDTLETPPVITAEFVYVRLRKADYTAADLGDIAKKVTALLNEGKDIFLFFKHEDEPKGPLNAELLLSRV